MKRSEINEAIKISKELLEKNHFRLPPFAYWTTDEWIQNKDKIGTIFRVMQGWDITDFGSGKFQEIGAVLFTIRNGDVNDNSIGTPYAEKIIILQHEKGQKIPMHCHRVKTEDIINRGGGILSIQLYASDAKGDIDKNADVEVYMDGIKHYFKAGETIDIQHGGSITLTPYVYHTFWAKKGAGDLIVGEVSSINDDNTDNVFTEPASRFAVIDEDEAILHPLVNEYNKL
ncbi:MAG: hypothetical protein A2W90_14345 [Bacteroidetes bacterium GWF2_42_66]|nr:MAG: hypothetical protein A2W92_19580 [Bacteroidetes bacterium GWA2_42_15]OFY01577.1 MAG: hypothetical protein A2W89_11880 [Bacteroidetes bacterium GWE2_42_39]OFY46708.1 MAG: hypothetical protein A2W90_14345 [Bacteroidetes bacterium GWF2_42_66]HAZ04370.1 D-lyxose/D-mannose family sugar isomerase [Marinilabiliales bacterium]HBL73888.1 D-lyxose/D-mannose family sugar isomerase [Prolixibacteraceae bacterium]